MKKIRSILLYCSLLLLISMPVAPAHATPIAILEIIKAAVKKVIVAVDLQIQRLQNKTIWLQNAQKTLENTMSKLKLDEISDWTERQRTLYKDYFEELNKVKSLISYYQRIREITGKQARLVADYKRAWSLFKDDKRFSASELAYMGQVYEGILNETIKNIDQIMLVVTSFHTQMTDAKRMEIINAAADKVDENYTDLKTFNQQNALLSIQRTKTDQEAQQVKQLYGIK